MSTTENDVVEYPESDGQPMGETDWHIYWILRLRDLLQTHFRDQRVYVGTDLLVYYEEGNPKKVVVPDVFVVLNCDPSFRRTFKIWEEERVPSVVFEITSRSTAIKDLEDKPKLYASLGVREYFLFDPETDYLVPPLRGFHLQPDAREEMEGPEFYCATLNCQVVHADGHLDLLDPVTRAPWLTTAEQQTRLAEQQMQLAERQTRLTEKQTRLAEQERQRANQAEEARIAAETELAKLRQLLNKKRQ